MQLTAHNDVFALPYKGGFLVYAPLVGRVAYGNAECVAQLRTYLERLDPSVVDAEIVSRLGGLHWLTGGQVPLPLPTDRLFHPTSTTLFLTNRCNLACTYCYAEAGGFEPHDMPKPLFRAAIDLVTKNARRAGHPPMIGFHGGGEPTVAWETLVDAVDYARSVGGPGVRFGIATNGVMARDHAEFVAATFPVVTLSLDGPPDIHDAQRPRADGCGSYDAVMAFVEVLRAHKTPFVIRSTITCRNVHRMSDMVEFLVRQTGCRQLHFEPAFSSGRCENDGSQLASPDAFAERFIEALQTARDMDAHLRFSAVRLMGTFLSFCGCAQDAFNVTHSGNVTACFEVCEGSQPLSPTFFFGKYDPASGAFAIDYDRLAFLRALNVHNSPKCAKCFAKWNCAGDCPVKAGFGGSAEPQTPRCVMIQTITKAVLERSLSAVAP